MPKYLLGIDESGTGAWAGSFTVAGIVVPTEHPYLCKMLKRGSINDSKRMNDARRRKALDRFIDHVLFGKIAVVDVSTITDLGNRNAWRKAIAEVIEEVHRDLNLSISQSSVDIVVDGRVDKVLYRQYPWIRFIPKADSTVPAVAAASIFAKTVRNDLMIDLGKKYPEFGFGKHYGYGTLDHRYELRKYGKTAEHRPIKSMPRYTTEIYVPDRLLQL